MNVSKKEIEKYIETEVAPKSSLIVSKANVTIISPIPINRNNPPKNLQKKVCLPKYFSIVKYKDNYYKHICPFLQQ